MGGWRHGWMEACAKGDALVDARLACVNNIAEGMCAGGGRAARAALTAVHPPARRRARYRARWHPWGQAGQQLLPPAAAPRCPS